MKIKFLILESILAIILLSSAVAVLVKVILK